LNVKKQDFFNKDDIDYVYDHDSIHWAIKHMNRPAYEFFKADAAEVMCSRDLFEAQPENVKLNAVLEEAYVLALERSQIPFQGEITPERSFKVALMKVCTSITSGWFREFAWENYYQVLARYSDDYVDRFWTGVQSGVVKTESMDV